jgi:ribosomal protein S27E
MLIFILAKDEDINIVLNNFRNLIKYMKAICPECLSKKIIVDKSKGEIYCSKCGLILQGNEVTINSKTIIYDLEIAKKLGDEIFKRNKSNANSIAIINPNAIYNYSKPYAEMLGK